MKKFMVLTFLLMGWGYYELSGGADFVPQSRPAEVAGAEPAPATPDEVELGGIEIVTRAEAPVTLAALTEPAAEPAQTIEIPAEDIAAAVQAATPEPEPAPVVEAALPTVEADLREVTGDRVNLRDGPGRDFAAIDQLISGTVVEVLEAGEGAWVRIEVIATGQSGWMSADFLAGIEG